MKRSSLVPLFLVFLLPPLSAADQPPADETKYAPMPWHLVDNWWDIGAATPFESLVLDVTISDDVPASVNLYIAPIGLAHLSKNPFYGGIQTQSDGNTKKDRKLRRLGPGFLLSMWGERTFDAIRPSIGGFCQSSGHEGDFVSVRRPYAWKKGKYTYRLTRMDREEIDGKPHTWVGAFVYSHENDENVFVGALRFKGENLVLARKIANFVEIYGKRRPVADIPKVTVTFGPPVVNGKAVKNPTAEAIYPKGVPDYADVATKDGSLVVTVGRFVKDRVKRRVQILDGKKPSAAAPVKPVKVFILAGQSNMEGQAVADLDGKEYNDGKGTLKALLKDPARASLVKHLVDDKGQWTARENVWVRYQPEKGPVKAGPLTLGFTPYGGKHHFGPELQFGHVVGAHFDNPVLLVKTAWGGKSLFKDFRPPSSGGEVGPYYKKMLADVRQALASLPTDFTAYKGQGYELGGLVWYQGWNDGVEPKKAVPEYEQNLVNLIKDVRKDLQAPDLPVVIGELTGPWVKAPGAWDALRKAQAAAARNPIFKGTAVFVETHDFVRQASDSPNPGHGHHEFGNAETCILVGDALGKAMVKLLDGPTKKIDAKPTSHTVRKIEGWTVRVDDRLLRQPNEELGMRALRFLEGKLSDIKAVVPADRVEKLQAVTIVLDLTHGNLRPMQYHPVAGWLKANGYSTDLAKCVHLPRAADLATRRNINEQPWVILHELAHAYHDQVLGFDEPRIQEAYEKYKKSGRGEKTLLYNGKRVRHYALTNPMEFFAEMTEAYFGVNDFFPFNRAELKEAEPGIHTLLADVWGPPPAKR